MVEVRDHQAPRAGIGPCQGRGAMEERHRIRPPGHRENEARVVGDSQGVAAGTNGVCQLVEG